MIEVFSLVMMTFVVALLYKVRRLQYEIELLNLHIDPQKVTIRYLEDTVFYLRNPVVAETEADMGFAPMDFEIHWDCPDDWGRCF